MSAPTHKWKFFRAGGLDQVVFRNGHDLVNLDALDQKLWVALSCPTRGVEFDARTLDLLDSDKDQRIRAPEFITASKWLREVLSKYDSLMKGTDAVALDAVNEESPRGKVLAAGMRRILENLGKEDADSITLSDVTDTTKIFVATKFNGDGIVPPESTNDPAAKKTIEDIMATHGSVLDRSGKMGVDSKIAEAFRAEVKAFVDWHLIGEKDKTIFVAGEQTEAAFGAMKAVRAKIDDFFARCRLAAFDARAAAKMNRDEADYAALAAKELTNTCDEIAGLPLACIEAGRSLSLDTGLNPAWSDAIGVFAKKCVAPLLGDKKTISEADWNALKTKLEAIGNWLATRPSVKVEKLGLERLKALAAGPELATVLGLIAKDSELKDELDQIGEVERLVRYHRDFARLANNFVNFSDFYSRKGAIFQIGSLYLDARACDLCVRVDDAGRHAGLAGLAKSYLAYCECTRPGSSEKMTIAAAFTGGDSDYLMVGRNGVFYDRQGRDWDATITKVIDNPISIKQAFWGPYKAFIRMIEQQVAKRAAAAQDESNKKLESTAAMVASADKAGPPVPQHVAPADQPKKLDIGLITGISVAIAGIGAFLSGILNTFFGLGIWMPIGFLGVILAISGPSMFIAWLKLRQRNLGPILDANGWAVNGRVKINMSLGGALTHLASLPSGSERAITDPYADKQRPWKLYIFLVLVFSLAIAWYLGKIDKYLPERVRSVDVLGKYAPTFGEKAPPTGTSPTGTTAEPAEKK